jgi:DNA mismatch repair ATPase MutL
VNHVVPPGYNIHDSVYALDAVLMSQPGGPSSTEDQAKAKETAASSSTPAESSSTPAPSSTTPAESSSTPAASSTTPAESSSTPAASSSTPAAVPGRSSDAQATAETPQSPTSEAGNKERKEEQEDNFVLWTPGAVRHTAMRLVVQDWGTFVHHVECAGQTADEKLANFKKGMARHAVTEVRD